MNEICDAWYGTHNISLQFVMTAGENGQEYQLNYLQCQSHNSDTVMITHII